MKRQGDETLIDLQDGAAVRARAPLLIAHRGGVITPSTPENTLAALHLAGSQGYDMVELDVSRSNEPIPCYPYQEPARR